MRLHRIILSVLIIALLPFSAGAVTGGFINGIQNVGQNAYVPSGELRNQDFSLTEPRSPLTIFALVLNSLFGLLGIILVSIVVYNGFRWLTAAGDDKKIGEARAAIVSAGIGLLIVLGAFSLSYFITRAIEETVRGPQYAPGTNIEIPDNVQLRFQL